jgi:hypothetical protein
MLVWNSCVDNGDARELGWFYVSTRRRNVLSLGASMPNLRGCHGAEWRVEGLDRVKASSEVKLAHVHWIASPLANRVDFVQEKNRWRAFCEPKHLSEVSCCFAQESADKCIKSHQVAGNSKLAGHCSGGESFAATWRP